MADDAQLAPACLNCDFEFVPARLNYCPMCGQETDLDPPTLLEFAQQFGGNYIAVEGALWRSLKLLLFKPGALTREYLDGRRRRYVLPLRLYLTISLIAFLLLRTLSVTSVDNATKVAPDAKPLHVAEINFGFGGAEVRDGRFTCTNLPDWVCRRLQKRLVLEPEAMVREVHHFVDGIVSNLGASMFVLLPAFALWLKLVYLNRGMRYTEHLVFALHTHAFWFVMMGLSLADWGWLDASVCAIVPTYTLLAMARVYGGRWAPRLLRALVVSVLYGLTLAPTMMALAFWVLLT